MKKLFVILLLLTTSLLAQFPGHRRENILHNRIPFFSEVHVIPGDSTNIIDYVYKIPYYQLTFIKDDNKYKAALSLAVEVHDTSGQFIYRQIKQTTISVNSFNETNSADKYCEDIMVFHLPNDEYNFLPVITDVQSGQEIRLDKKKVMKINTDTAEVLEPLVLSENNIELKGNEYPVLADFDDAIPFSPMQYELAIPVKDTSVQKIYVWIIDDKDTVYSSYINKSFLSDLSLSKVEGQIVINSDHGTKEYRNFILNNFSSLLSEGRAKIVVAENKDGLKSNTFFKKVIWFNKPFSLLNPEFAIASLKYIESDSLVSRLLDADNKLYPDELEKYWHKFDPTPNTKFNELMNEYYNRIDYAMKNFAPLSKDNGADTDRGRIYIKYGMPEKIERSSNDDGKVEELWIYTKENLSFRFVDKNGTGEFPLAKG
jgi:GWxTD domain-containing protein